MQNPLQQTRSWLQPDPRHTKTCYRLFSQSLLSSVSLSSISFSSGLASGLGSQVLFHLNHNFYSNHLLSITLSWNTYLCLYRAYSLPLYISPCLSLGPCIALLCPSIYPSMHMSVRPSVRVSIRQARVPHGGGEHKDPHFLRGW